jgi:hypothetical protein
LCYRYKGELEKAIEKGMEVEDRGEDGRAVRAESVEEEGILEGRAKVVRSEETDLHLYTRNW